MGDTKEILGTVATGGLNIVADTLLPSAEKPESAPVAAPPVSMQDKSVRDSAANKSRQLAAASRNKSRQNIQPGSTLAPY